MPAQSLAVSCMLMCQRECDDAHLYAGGGQAGAQPGAEEALEQDRIAALAAGSQRHAWAVRMRRRRSHGLRAPPSMRTPRRPGRTASLRSAWRCLLL